MKIYKPSTSGRSKEVIASLFSTTLTDEIILASEYTQENYEGHMTVIYQKNGSLFEINGSHCSCYGLEGQWKNPTEINIEYIEHKSKKGIWFFYGKYNSSLIKQLYESGLLINKELPLEEEKYLSDTEEVQVNVFKGSLDSAFAIKSTFPETVEVDFPYSSFDYYVLVDEKEKDASLPVLLINNERCTSGNYIIKKPSGKLEICGSDTFHMIYTKKTN